MSLATGIFTPWQSKQGGNTGGTYQRMAGDYMDQFTKQNPEAKKIIEEPKSSVMNVMGGSNYKKSSQESAANSSSSPAATTSTPTPSAKPASNDAGMAKYNAATDEIYKQNQAIIANYNGKNANNSTANGAAYNADVMSGINYDRAVRQNKKFDAIKASQASMAAGNDHGTTEHKAPKSKDYYSYLDAYDGPKTYDEVTQKTKQITGGMDGSALMAWEMEQGKKGERPYDKWEQWKKDKMDYEAAWGSGKSVAQQKGWN